MNMPLNRRRFLKAAATTSVTLGVPDTLCQYAFAQRSQRSDHYATGMEVAATSTSREATESALWAMRQGGNAADAYMTAALAQTVAEHGLTSIGGGFEIRFFDEESQQTHGIIGRLGPAAMEPYDFDRQSPITQTGRAMPVPGFLSGLYSSHRRFGKLPWSKLFEPAIMLAREGVAVSSLVLQAAKRKGAIHAEGKRLWMKDGRFLEPGEKLVQTQLGHLLEAIAADGPEVFYEGDFARHYCERSKIDGGRMTLEDMGRWRDLSIEKTNAPVGNYRGYQILSAELVTYALHLNEALDLSSTGSADKSPESVYRQIRIMEEVFLSTKDFSNDTSPQFVDPDYARKRAVFVLNSPLRKLTLDAIFNTCFLVVRDKEGNCAWGTHSINTPTAFGAGIVVDGVYAAHAISRKHVHGSGASAPAYQPAMRCSRTASRESSRVLPDSDSSTAPTNTARASSSGSCHRRQQ